MVGAITFLSPHCLPLVFGHLLGRAGGDGPALAEESEQGAPHPGVGLRVLGGVERRGEAVGKLFGRVPMAGVPFVVVGQEAQQESLATSRVKVWAASFNPSAMVR